MRKPGRKSCIDKWTFNEQQLHDIYNICRQVYKGQISMNEGADILYNSFDVKKSTSFKLFNNFILMMMLIDMGLPEDKLLELDERLNVYYLIKVGKEDEE